MDLFLAKGALSSYVNYIDRDEEFPLKYIHFVNNWEPSALPKLNTNFCIDGRTY